MNMDPALASKDDVIEAFLREDVHADPERVRQWVRRHPECRAELLAVAARLAVATAIGERREIGAAERGEIRARAVAHANASVEAVAGVATFGDLVEEAGLDIPELARRIDMPRADLAEVEAGHVEPPFVTQFVDLVARTLGRPALAVARALAVQGPAPMHAKATGDVALGRISWRELIEASEMSEERKAFWLDGA